jgi:hypothetical protein
MDREEKANSGHLAVTCHLPSNLSDSGSQRQQFNITDVSFCSLRLPLVALFLSLDQIRYELIGTSKTYRGQPGQCQSMPCRLVGVTPLNGRR